MTEQTMQTQKNFYITFVFNKRFHNLPTIFEEGINYTADQTIETI